MSLENEVYFFSKKGNSIFSIKLEQRLPKSFSQLHVKNSRFFFSYFLKKDDWPKAYAGSRLPTLPCINYFLTSQRFHCLNFQKCFGLSEFFTHIAQNISKKSQEYSGYFMPFSLGSAQILTAIFLFDLFGILSNTK